MYFFVQKRANECNIFVAFCTFPFSFVFANTHLSARGVYEAMTTVARYEPGVWAFYHSATFLTIVQCTFYRCYNQLIHIDPPTHQYRKEVAASRQVLYEWSDITCSLFKQLNQTSLLWQISHITAVWSLQILP